MTMLAENKRRAFAAVIVMLVLLAIGYGVGRIGHGTSHAQAAPTRAATRTITAPAVTRTTSSSTAVAHLRRELTGARRAQAQLRRTGRRAEGRVKRARRCEHDRHAARQTRCVKAAVGS